jgi:sugar phosphate isomerase/epimerase
MIPISLAHLTAIGLSPPELIGVAARSGYRYVGIRMLPAVPGGIAYPLFSNPALLQETAARLKDCGMGVLDIEVVRIDSDFNGNDFTPFLEVGAQLSAREVQVVGHDREHHRLVENFGKLCELAASYKLGVALEPMPWTAIKDLKAALSVVSAADCANGGVLIDTLHFIRGGDAPSMLRSVPAGSIRFVQVSDADAKAPDTVDEMIHVARNERKIPGEGGLPLEEIMTALPSDAPIAIEMPIRSLAERYGYEVCVRKGAEATQALVARVKDRKF